MAYPVNARRTTLAGRYGAAGTLLAVFALTAACGSSGPTASRPPSTSARVVAGGSSSGGASSSGASSGGASTSQGGIALTGDLHGTLTAALCAGGVASIEAHLDGDSMTYRGSISAASFGFVGPDAAVYSLKSGDPKPTVSGSTFTVHDAHLVDLVGGKVVVASGTVTCP